MTNPADSGPFCVHWGDPAECDIKCLRDGCGHPCRQHLGACSVDVCPCRGLMFKQGDRIVEE